MSRHFRLPILSLVLATLAGGAAWSADDAATLAKDAKALKATATADLEKAQKDLQEAGTLEATAKDNLRQAAAKEHESEMAANLPIDQLVAGELRRRVDANRTEAKAIEAQVAREKALEAVATKDTADLKATIADLKGKNASADQLKTLQDLLDADTGAAKDLHSEVDRLGQEAKRKETVAEKFEAELKALEPAKSATKAASATPAAPK
jgi:hypothetical protein